MYSFILFEHSFERSRYIISIEIIHKLTQVKEVQIIYLKYSIITKQYIGMGSVRGITEKGKGPGWKWEKEKGRWRKEYGGRGGGGRKWIKMSSLSNRLWGPHFQLNSLAYTGGGGWRMNLEFCRYIWIFVVTLEFRPYANKGHYCTDKILVIYQQSMEKNCVFPTQNYETFGSLGSNAFFLFFEFPARRCRHYETNQSKHGHIVPTKYVILPTRYYIDWLRRIICFRRKSTKISARSQSFMGFLEFPVFRSE